MTHKNLHWTLQIAFIIIVALSLAACGGDEENKDEAKSYTVAAMMQNPSFTQIWDAFKTEMAARGYVEGKNITYYNEPSPDLLAQHVQPGDIDLLLVLGGTFGMESNSLSMATGWVGDDVPIVIAPASGDPVASGDAESLSQPGGRITGILLSDSDAKRFELFVAMLPDDATTVAIVYDPNNVTGMRQLSDIEAVAEEAGIELLMLSTSPSDPNSTAQAFATIPDDVDGVFLHKIWGTSSEWFVWSFHHNVPTSQDGYIDLPIAQPMMSYGPSLPGLGADAARLVDQVFKGTPPGDLPMEYADFDLMIDLNYAEAIGLEIPQAVVDQTQEVRRTDLSVYPPPEDVVDTGDEDSTPDTVTHPVGTGACAARIATMAGTFTVCVTTPCDTLADRSGITYEDKSDVASCTPTGVIGTCAAADFDTIYYDGDPAVLSVGCGFMQGTWSDAD